MKWDPASIPPASVCPEEFCFHWVSPGGYADTSGRRHKSFADAARAATTHYPNGGCSCTFGICSRLDPENGFGDYYESHEPNVERAGLPWFYFFTPATQIRKEPRERFLREAAKYWKDFPPDHWDGLEEYVPRSP